MQFLKKKRVGTLFDWLPDLGHVGPLPIAWLILVAVCFIAAAILTYDACAIASIPVIGFASQMGIEAAGQSC